MIDAERPAAQMMSTSVPPSRIRCCTALIWPRARSRSPVKAEIIACVALAWKKVVAPPFGSSNSSAVCNA
jgi:hypothetical protein